MELTVFPTFRFNFKAAASALRCNVPLRFFGFCCKEDQIPLSVGA